jgi:site-specific DNA recombinase
LEALTIKKTLRLIGFCRVSTGCQREEGTIEIQLQALKEYAEENGHELAAVFCDEAISGGLEDRPGLSELFDFLEDNPGVDGVLIYKLDRLARDLYIQEHLIKKLEGLGKHLFSIKEPNLESSDPMRKAFRQFMGIVSELEKAFITMRLCGGRINKARKGGYAGGATALGYKAEGKELRVDLQEAETVKAIFRMRRHKRMGLRQIAKQLNEKGIPTARGGRWHAGTVKYILENPLYKGALNYKDQSAKRADLALL